MATTACGPHSVACASSDWLSTRHVDILGGVGLQTVIVCISQVTTILFICLSTLYNDGSLTANVNLV